MRKAIDTAPRNGDFVFLEDAARGTVAFARWSAEAAQWLDEDDTPSQLNATHWHSLQNLVEEGTPSQLNAAFWHPLSPAQSVVETVDEIGSLTNPSKPSAWRIYRGASRPASGSITAQPQRAATPERSVNVWARFVGFAGRGCGKILSAFAVAGNLIVHSRRSIATMAACLLVAAALAPLLYRSDLGEWVFHRTALEDDTGLKQALRQEQERANKPASDVTAARREAESQAALIRQAGEASGGEKVADGESQRIIGELRKALKQQEDKIAQANVHPAEQPALKHEQDKAEKLRVELAAPRHEAESHAAIMRSARDEAARLREASARATEELRQAHDKADQLAGELAAARQEVEAQTTAARAASDEARRAAETSKQGAEEQGQVLREAQGEAKKLATALAAAQREVQSQESAVSSARDQAAGVKEAAERSADEQQRALQQERDKTEKLTAELAEARSSLEAQTKAKAAEEVAQDSQLAAVRGELKKAKAEATVAQESLEAERTRTQRVQQQLASIQESMGPRASRSPAEATTVGQPSIAASSVPEAPTKARTEDVQQPTNMATRPSTNLEQGSPQAVRLIARANLLLDQGNIGAARNMLDRAAEMGSTEALFWLAETYDPLLLAARRTFGTQSDIAKARELYGKALAGGVSQAKARLEALQQ